MGRFWGHFLGSVFLRLFPSVYFLQKQIFSCGWVKHYLKMFSSVSGKTINSLRKKFSLAAVRWINCTAKICFRIRQLEQQLNKQILLLVRFDFPSEEFFSFNFFKSFFYQKTKFEKKNTVRKSLKN